MHEDKKKRLQSWTIVFDLFPIIEDGFQHDIKYMDVHSTHTLCI